MYTMNRNMHVCVKDVVDTDNNNDSQCCFTNTKKAIYGV